MPEIAGPDKGNDGAAETQDKKPKTALRRRFIRYWILRMGLAAVLCALCIIAIAVGIRGHLATGRMQARSRSIHVSIQNRLLRIETELNALRLSPEDAGRTRLVFWAAECQEELDRLDGSFGSVLAGSFEYRDMQKGWTELSQAIEAVGDLIAANVAPADERALRDAVKEAEVELEVFRGEYAELDNELAGIFADRERHARRWLYMAILTALGTGGLCLWTGLSVLSETSTHSGRPALLDQRIAKAGADPVFLSRMKYLCRERGLETPNGAWTLSVKRIVSNKPTHQCFEVEARNGDQTVPLWGRFYRWPSRVRALTRFMFPMYGQATRRGLTLLKQHGIPAPELIYHQRLRKGPFRAECLVLTEHLGDLQLVKMFVDSEFCLLEEPARRELLRKVVAFLDDVHDAGLYHLRPRHIMGRSLDDPYGKIELCVCDLDKLLIWERAPRPAERYLRWRDRQRMLKRFQRSLEADDFAALEEMMKQHGPDSPAER